MIFKTPDFWYPSPKTPSSRNPAAEVALSPFSTLYNFGRILKQSLGRTKPYKSNIPVVCVGNLIAGGGGKTPSLLALHKIIIEHHLSKSPCLLSRGYGGKLTGPHWVNLGHDTVHDVGDEPLMHVQRGKTLISRDRVKGAIEASANECDLILMDDGFQNPTLHKDLSFIVIDGRYGFGNMKLLPAGPLREPLSAGLSRADAIILIGTDDHDLLQNDILPHNLPVFNAHIKPTFSGDTNAPHIAFCGLARPDKFYNSLKEIGLNVIEKHDFPDHYVYSDAIMNKLQGLAEQKNAILITTEKDYMRLSPEHRKTIKILPIDLEFEHPDAILTFLKERLQR